MMIVYSTEPGKVAMDGTGRNSPFTAALLQQIDTEGASISDVMIAVRNDVLKATGGKQRPFESASLTSQFFFKPAAAATAADTSSETSAELTALRQEITRLQADQGALLKSQQEQSELLQKKLAEETKTSEQARQQPGPGRSRRDQPGDCGRARGKWRCGACERVRQRPRSSDCRCAATGRHQDRCRRKQGRRGEGARSRQGHGAAIAGKRRP